MSVVNNNHPKGVTDEQYTPKLIFETLNVNFDLDVCAPFGGNPYLPFADYFTKEVDGLQQEWYGNVWMNPPYSKPTPWVEKFCQHARGVALLPVTTGKYFQNVWNKADGLVILPHNQKFERPDGLKTDRIRFRTMLVAFGQDNANALLNFKDFRVR